MKQKVFTLLTLLVLCVTGAWADPVELININFADEADASIDVGTSKTVDGISVYSKAAASLSNTHGLIGSNNAKNTNYWFAIPIENINGSISITFTCDNNRPNYSYAIVECDDLPATYSNPESLTAIERPASGKVASATNVAVSKTKAVLYFGLTSNGSSYATSNLVVTTPASSGKTPSSFALTSASEVEVAISGNSTITTLGNAGTVTYTSNNTDVATVTDAGVITAVAGGKTTITVSDPGSAEVDGKDLTVTVLVPYPNPIAADSYVFTISQYDFSNTAKTKHYFKNGFTMTSSGADNISYASIESNTGIKYSHVYNYVLNIPANVTITYATIKARSNYNTSDKANWGTVLGTDYSSIELPQNNQDPAEKDFVVASPSVGGTFAFSPGGNQWQAIITLNTTEYHAKYPVTFDSGEGTGSMEGTEVRGGSTYALPASTFTAPAEKGFAGWLCSVDGQTYAAGADYTMTDAPTTFTAQYEGVEGKMIIKALATARNTYAASGAIGGTVSGSGMGSDNIDGGYKFNRPSKIILNIASGWTFKTGDVLNVHITSASNSAGATIALYDKDNIDKDHVVYNTGVAGVVGDNMFVLPAAVNGQTSICVARPNDKSNEWNAYVDYIEVIRPDVITLNAKGYATYSRKSDFEVFSGGTAYKMALNESTKTIAGTAIDTAIPAGEGILLRGDADAKVNIIETTGAAALVDNDLKGSTKSNGTLADMPTYCYVLSGDTFKKFTGATLTANKAFFAASGDLKGHALTMTFDDGETTAIKAVEAKKVENGVFYNLAGQQVAQPTKGLYIVNGRKVIVK